MEYFRAKVWVKSEKGLVLYNQNHILKMAKRPGFNNEKFKRVHRKELRFNAMELNAINTYCERYNIKNKSKFLREAIISKILHQFDQDHPKLF